MKEKTVVLKRAAFGFGFTLNDDGQPFVSTATVAKVEPGGAADLGGIRVGDRVLTINGQPVRSMNFLEASNAIRASSEVVELELASPDYAFEPRARDSIRIRASSPCSPRSRDTAVDNLSDLRSGMDTGNRAPCAAAPIRTLTIVSRSTTSAETTARETAFSSTDTSPPKPISSLPCTNSNPSRLSISITRYPLLSTMPVSTSSPSQPPVPRPRRTRNPLTTCNQSMVVTARIEEGEGQVNTEPVASTPCIIVQSAPSKDSSAPASPSAIFDGSRVSPVGLSQSDVATINSQPELTPSPDRPKDEPVPGTVRVRHLDANLTKKAHRRQTFTRVCLYGDTGDDGSSVGAPPVRFVRKRAYASARHAGRFDQFAAFSLSPDDRSWSSHSSSTPTAVLNVDSNSSPCQLLPAAPQNTPPSNVHIVEPKITHLPRRRSSKAQSGRPTVSLRRSRNSGEYKRPDEPPPGSPVPPGSDGTVRDQSTSGVPSAADDCVCVTKTDSHPISDSEVIQNNDTARKPLQPPSLTSNQTPIPEVSLPTGKPDRPAGRLWASFDSDPDDNPFDWWSRVGETYQHLDLEYQRLVRRQTRLQQRLRGPDAVESSDEFALGSNKENKDNGSMKSERREIGGVLGRGPLARMSASISSHATWSSPVNRRTDRSPVLSMGTTQTDNGDSQLSIQSNASRRRQLRNLCSGLRYHRSESNIHHDMSGSFRSRQSLCKILALDGSTNKSYSWKPYYLCIAGSEARFIKASSAFYGGNRKSKSAKQLSGDVTTGVPVHLNDLIDDQRSQDGSFNTSHSTLSGFDSQPNRTNWGPVSTTSSTSVLLPLPGLIWAREPVPPDLPHWCPLAPATGPPATASRKPSPVPDTMDPRYSGLSEPAEGTENTGVTLIANGDESAPRVTFPCYRFAHVGAGVELLFVFPDENTAMACLKMCEMSGGREATALDIKLPLDSDRTHRKPYDLLFLNRPQSKDSVSNADNGVTRPLSSDQTLLRYPVGGTDSTKSDTVRPVAAAPWPPHTSVQFKLTDRRQRRLEQQFSLHDGSVIRLVDSPVPVDGGRRVPANLQADSRSLQSSVLNAPATSVHTETPLEDKSTQRVTKSRQAAPFLRGIKQWLNRPTFPNGSTATETQPATVAQSPAGVNDVEAKLSAVLADPPDFSDFETPGPIFGAPLERQIPSPDQPCVPLILHALVLGLETHGLHLAGLYRKPGRHRTIAQFVCVANLAPCNVDLLLKLDAWREPNALCGLVKQFLRRIPTGLFASATWEPLASLVDSRSSENSSQLAYLLLSIRVKLRKLASEAFGISIGNAIPVPPTTDSDTLESELAATSPGTSPISRVPTHTSPIESPVVPVSGESVAAWRWATLCYLVRHIRDVVALRRLNEVSYQCIAICFGPVFFGESPNLTRLNGVLENLFRHWPWLIQDLPLVTFETMESGAPPNSAGAVHDYTLAEAVDYLTHFEAQFSAAPHVPSPVTIVRSQSADQSEATESDAGPGYASPSPRSSDDQLNTQPVSPAASAECYDHVCHVVRTLLDRASESGFGTRESVNGQRQTANLSLHRVASAISSTPHGTRQSQNHSASSRRRKTLDTNSTRTLNRSVRLEYRRPKSGRAGLNPSHLEPIRGDPVLSSPHDDSNQQRTTDGVIPRPLVPTRTYLAADRPSLTADSPAGYKL